MADIRPFCGVRYNREKTNDLALVICPPYDIISSDWQRALYDRSPHNFVRIEYGEVLPQDSVENNRYTRAGDCFKAWQTDRILIDDTMPAFYIHDHYFIYQGKEFRRRGLACRVRLEEWANMIVRPHESTFAAHRSDRSRLLWALEANTSPVLAMYRDRSGDVAQIAAKAATGVHIATASLLDGERHELYSIVDSEEKSRLERTFAEMPLYIADGHHRYESALAYQRENKALNPNSPDAPYNFILMTLVDMDDPELLILPPHRLLRGLSQTKITAFETGLSSFFDVEEMALGENDIWQKVETLQNDPSKLRLVLVGPGNMLRVLTIKDYNTVKRIMPCYHTDAYKRLDVSMVNHIILEELLGLKPDDEAAVTFNYDRADTVQKIMSGEFQVAFIVKPVQPEVIKDIADDQDRMPRKSTYFYPKLPSGLLMNRVA